MCILEQSYFWGSLHSFIETVSILKSKKVTAVSSACAPWEWPILEKLSRSFENIEAAYGLHPYEIGSNYQKDLGKCLDYLKQNPDSKVGETGIDRRFPGYGPHEEQESVFILQAKVALELKRPVITVSGADLMDGSPIVDIKPYLPFADAVPEATGGFTDGLSSEPLSLEFPQAEPEKVAFEKRESLLKILADDPRPAYQENSDRIYGFRFASYEIKFKVENGRLFVLSVEERND